MDLKSAFNPNTQISTIPAFELDSDDYRDIKKAFSIRQKYVMPDSGSSPTGAMFAEICRGYLEYVSCFPDILEQEKGG